MLQRVEAKVREVRGLGVTEDPEDAAFVLELVHHEGLRPLVSVRRHAIARAGSKCRSMAVVQICSASLAGASSTRRPSIDTRMRWPPTSPIRRAGTRSRA